MPTYMSPSVNVVEKDLSVTIPSVSSTICGLVGEFEWGECFTRIPVGNDSDLITLFGEAKDDNYLSWYSAYNFLQYPGQLYVVRVLGTGSLNAGITFLDEDATPTTPLAAATYLGNEDDVENETPSFDDNESMHIYGKYPGIKGNNISVSVANYDDFETAEADDGITFKSLFEYLPESDEIAIVVWDDDTIVERYIVSTTTTSKDFEGNNNYIENYINRRSNYIVIFHDSTNSIDIASQEKSALTGGVNIDAANSDITNGFDLYNNPEEFDVNMIIDGEYTNSATQQYIIDYILNVRKDCVGYFTVPKDTVVGQATVSAAINDMITYRKNTLIRSSSYFALYANWKYQYDKINDKNRWLPLSADIAGITAYTAMTRDAWFAPAGYNRGLIKGVVKLAINPIREYRDLLYPENLNPCIVDSTDGPVVLGQKTGQAKPSAFDRLDVRWLFIILEKSIATASKYFMFEKNTNFTRRLFIGMVSPFLRDVQGREGIYEFRVVCNEVNNTPEIIDRNEFIADILIKPTRTAEFITLNFVCTKTGASFDEIIGQG